MEAKGPLKKPINMVGTVAELEEVCIKGIYMAQLQVQLEQD